MAYNDNKLPSELEELTDSTIDILDNLVVGDTSDSGRVKRITWANIKLAVKTYLNSFYVLIGSITTSGLTVNTAKILGRASVGTGTIEELPVTGTGNVVMSSSPTITTPIISKPVMSATNPTAQTYTPAAAGTATLDLSLSNQHFITMPAGNITIALSNDTNNQPFIITITQDGVGSRTVTWPATIRWAGGTVPALTTTASKRDIFGLIRTGASTYDGVIIGTNI